MVFDLRLKKNFKIFLSGPSGCGKTTFITDLIINLDQISVDPPKKVIYFYKEWQTKFTDMEQTLGVNFIEVGGGGNPMGTSKSQNQGP